MTTASYLQNKDGGAHYDNCLQHMSICIRSVLLPSPFWRTRTRYLLETAKICRGVNGPRNIPVGGKVYRMDSMKALNLNTRLSVDLA
jgi:hypothetical protein